MVEGGAAHVFEPGFGLHAIDVTTPPAPRLLASVSAEFERLDEGAALARRGETVIVLQNVEDSFATYVDFSDPGSPRVSVPDHRGWELVEVERFGDELLFLARGGSWATLVLSRDGLPRHPVAGRWGIPGELAADGSHVFLSDRHRAALDH